MAKSDGLLFKYRSPMSPYSLQSRGWWCGTDGARVTSRLFSGPCKQSRPMTCSIVPFEEEASSVTTKKNQGVPLLTIGSSSWLQRGKQGCTAAFPFCSRTLFAASQVADDKRCPEELWKHLIFELFVECWSSEAECIKALRTQCFRSVGVVLKHKYVVACGNVGGVMERANVYRLYFKKTQPLATEKT
ncbi:hypothetical protein Q9966_015841 [Columba livia]|nr:hypothetical protein Q9966_015841 [Columba livia]